MNSDFYISSKAVYAYLFENGKTENIFEIKP
ncbi:hypothetical protein X275_08915 [Marinitoga sp. 1197]|nr:hypothetical protein X275_08915 [Marinitoga sp. 1197]